MIGSSMHFISTVVLVGMLNIMLSPSSGLIGAIYKLFGAQAPNLLASPRLFPSLYVWSDVWQNAGWDAIVYLAALASVDPNLYEAATVDGAGKLRCAIHITLPGLLPTFIVIALLAVANFMNSGLDQYFMFQNAVVMKKIEVLDLYTYRVGLQNQDYSYATAVGMLKSLISLAMLFTTNAIAKHVRGDAIV